MEISFPLKNVPDLKLKIEYAFCMCLMVEICPKNSSVNIGTVFISSFLSPAEHILTISGIGNTGAFAVFYTVFNETDNIAKAILSYLCEP